ncbi:Flp pilus assembly protein CpaB [Terriglobus roseus]|uniref:Pilus assembly protein CpaB n=1 Tax=Terriglobus roseus TaxID=392734 RepID=A0A1G7PBF6_9BACT|nr:Flp pilus assembly protein CpaB [Terriglobus roseus]SDF83636.1 pilus assembly protein CpaB [Terriglobus roseus]
MQPRRILIALTVALVVSGLFTLWLGTRLSHRGSSSGSTKYVALAKNLDPGQIIAADDLKQVSWPSDVPLPGAFVRTDEVIGKSALYPLQAGEPLTARQLATSAGLSAHIPAGMRAISLKSNEVVGVAGYLLPGTHVDVLVTVRAASSTDPVTSIVLQDAQVLTAGEKMQPDPDGHASKVDVVTLLVSPEEAEKIVLASTQGTVHFVLRNGGDHVVAANAPMSLSALGVQASSTVAPAAVPHAPAHTQAQPVHTKSTPATYSIQVRRGDKDSVETF